MRRPPPCGLVFGILLVVVAVILLRELAKDHEGILGTRGTTYTTILLAGAVLILA